MPLPPAVPFINLDHAATTTPEPLVIQAIVEAMQSSTANPSAAYSAAGNPRRLLREARATLAAMLDCAPQELFFTSGGTESNNWALRQAAGRHVVLSAIEHKSVLLAAQNQGCSISYVAPQADGTLSPAAVEAALRPDTALVSVQLANNEIGALQPVAELGRLIRARNILFHCDAVQGFGQLSVAPHQLGVDLLSASAHKLYGPRGIGLLFVRQGITTQPLLAGGGQEGGRRAGTENVAAAHGFAVAASLAAADMAVRNDHALYLRTLLLQALEQAAPQVTQLCATAPRLPAITSLLLPHMSSEEMIARLDVRGIAVAGGAACASSSGQPSHVLLAMGLSPRQASSVIRISVGRHSTPQEIAAAAAAIGEILSTAH